MQTMFCKENDGIVHNPGQSSSLISAPLWNAFGSPSVDGESFGHLKSFSLDQLTHPGQITKQAERVSEQGMEKRNAFHFAIFPGNSSNSLKAHKPPTAISQQLAPPECCGRFELGLGQPFVYAKNSHGDQCYGVFSTYGPQVLGRIMLPLQLNGEEPIYVNAKQYRGIIRRRQSRAKAQLENKYPRGRKPYMHESRHLHAMRRPRGCGGRFLNTKNVEKEGNETKKSSAGQPAQGTGSQTSESGGTMNSSREANGCGSNLSGSEVTSIYSKGDLEHLSITHLQPPLQSFSDFFGGGRNVVMPGKWAAAVDNCCNLKV